MISINRFKIVLNPYVCINVLHDYHAECLSSSDYFFLLFKTFFVIGLLLSPYYFLSLWFSNFLSKSLSFLNLFCLHLSFGKKLRWQEMLNCIQQKKYVYILTCFANVKWILNIKISIINIWIFYAHWLIFISQFWNGFSWQEALTQWKL